MLRYYLFRFMGDRPSWSWSMSIVLDFDWRGAGAGRGRAAGGGAAGREALCFPPNREASLFSHLKCEF